MTASSTLRTSTGQQGEEPQATTEQSLCVCVCMGGHDWCSDTTNSLPFTLLPWFPLLQYTHTSPYQLCLTWLLVSIEARHPWGRDPFLQALYSLNGHSIILWAQSGVSLPEDSMNACVWQWASQSFYKPSMGKWVMKPSFVDTIKPDGG